MALHEKFRHRRTMVLNLRYEVSEELKSGFTPAFQSETEHVRKSEWKVASAPKDLECRHVEITGPCESKMMINALNSGADVFMADLEDSLAPSWENVVSAHQNLCRAVRRELAYDAPNGKQYRLKDNLSTLIVRPRGWHLLEKNFLVDNEPVSGSLFDFGLYFFHNARELIRRGSGPYFYLPKLENHFEARLWNDVFLFAQDYLDIPRGTIRATVLIETILAAFEMEEILFELREHASGLNAGRWDYLFSILKKLHRKNQVFPERGLLTMDLPFLQSYCELLVQTCHRRGAHAIGGMSAFIPSRTDSAANDVAFKKVREDKIREVRIGFDGSWVAHPDLVPLVKEIFLQGLQGKAHQKSELPPRQVSPVNLLPRDLPKKITEAGVRTNIYVALKYIHSWLNGLGAVAIHNLMEDAATAEISRAQLWQWVKMQAWLEEGYALTPGAFKEMLNEELSQLRREEQFSEAREATLRDLLEYLVLHHEFVEFLTKPAYEILLHSEKLAN